MNRDRDRDQDGNSSDWLEIHNPRAAPLDVGGYYLTDSPTQLAKWEVPRPTVIPAGGFLVVFASGKNRAVAGQELHTGFKLSAKGEYLALVAPDAKTVVSAYAPTYPAQLTDVSYGLAFDPGLTTTRVFFASPTPGVKNGKGDLMPDIIDCFRADASLGETMEVLRQVYDYGWWD